MKFNKLFFTFCCMFLLLTSLALANEDGREQSISQGADEEAVKGEGAFIQLIFSKTLNGPATSSFSATDTIYGRIHVSSSLAQQVEGCLSGLPFWDLHCAGMPENWATLPTDSWALDGQGVWRRTFEPGYYGPGVTYKTGVRIVSNQAIASSQTFSVTQATSCAQNVCTGQTANDQVCDGTRIQTCILNANNCLVPHYSGTTCELGTTCTENPSTSPQTASCEITMVCTPGETQTGNECVSQPNSCGETTTGVQTRTCTTNGQWGPWACNAQPPSDDECFECDANNPCPEGQECNQAGVCVVDPNYCSEDADCKEELVCDLETNTCVEPTGPAPAICGDGLEQAGEECDFTSVTLSIQNYPSINIDFVSTGDSTFETTFTLFGSQHLVRINLNEPTSARNGLYAQVINQSIQASSQPTQIIPLTPQDPLSEEFTFLYQDLEFIITLESEYFMLQTCGAGSVCSTSTCTIECLSEPVPGVCETTTDCEGNQECIDGSCSCGEPQCNFLAVLPPCGPLTNPGDTCPTQPGCEFANTIQCTSQPTCGDGEAYGDSYCCPKGTVPDYEREVCAALSASADNDYDNDGCIDYQDRFMWSFSNDDSDCISTQETTPPPVCEDECDPNANYPFCSYGAGPTGSGSQLNACVMGPEGCYVEESNICAPNTWCNDNTPGACEATGFCGNGELNFAEQCDVGVPTISFEPDLEFTGTVSFEEPGVYEGSVNGEINYDLTINMLRKEAAFTPLVNNGNQIMDVGEIRDPEGDIQCTDDIIICNGEETGRDPAYNCTCPPGQTLEAIVVPIEGSGHEYYTSLQLGFDRVVSIVYFTFDPVFAQGFETCQDLGYESGMLFCNPLTCGVDTNLCGDELIPCEEDGECESGECNDAGICEPNPCNGDEDCESGECNDAGYCTPPYCDANEDCESGICNQDTGVCLPPIPCEEDAECESGECNDAGVCEPNPCSEGSECESGVCLESGVCQPPYCDDNSDCESGICNQDTGVCTPGAPPCESNNDCPGNQVCNLDTGVCTAPPSTGSPGGSSGGGGGGGGGSWVPPSNETDTRASTGRDGCDPLTNPYCGPIDRPETSDEELLSVSTSTNWNAEIFTESILTAQVTNNANEPLLVEAILNIPESWEYTGPERFELGAGETRTVTFRVIVGSEDQSRIPISFEALAAGDRFRQDINANINIPFFTVRAMPSFEERDVIPIYLVINPQRPSETFQTEININTGRRTLYVELITNIRTNTIHIQRFDYPVNNVLGREARIDATLLEGGRQASTSSERLE